MKRKSKWLSVLVAIIMLATMMPFGTIANAADTIEILDLANLQKIGSDSAYPLSGNYTLTGDITITGAWTPIGTENAPFTGTFNGNGFTIKFKNVTVSSNTSYYGLFGKVGSGAEISNVKIVDSNITLGKDILIGKAGFIAGYNAGTIQNCSVTGSKFISTVSANGTFYIGSIAGYNTGSVTQSYSTSDLDTTYSPVYGLNIKAGGITGENSTTGLISSSYNTGTITAKAAGNGGTCAAIAGGISGYNNGEVSLSYNTGVVLATGNAIGSAYTGGISGTNNKKIINCYNSGNLSSDAGLGSLTGGITGENKLTGDISLTYNEGMLNGYLTGGIAGINDYQAEVKDKDGNVTTHQANGKVENSYYYYDDSDSIYDSALYGYTYSNGVTDNSGKLKDTQMRTLSNFTGFDSSSVWQMATETPDYPYPALKSVPHLEAAENTSDYAGGNGTLYNPYKIENKTQLNNIRNSDKYMTSCYVLTKDILFTNWDFNSKAENETNYFKNSISISEAVIVDNSTDKNAVSSITLSTDSHITTLAELIANDKLPTAININGKVCANITDWKVTPTTTAFDGTTKGTYSLTPIWKVPSGYTKPENFSDPTLTVTVNTVQSQPTVTGSAEFEWDTGYSNTITLSNDENIVLLSDLVASGKLPNIVKVRSGSEGSYTYTWKHIDATKWAVSGGGTFNASSTTPSSYTLTANTDDISPTTVTVTVNIAVKQTDAMSEPKDGDFYNGGLCWIPIGVKTADTAVTTDDKKYYTGTADSFRGIINGNDGSTTHSIYNLKINANAVDSTASSPTPYDAYAGLVGINNGVIQKLIIDNEPATTEAKNALLPNAHQIALFSGDTYSTYVNVSASATAYAGMIAGNNEINGRILDAQIKCKVTTQASGNSYAGGTTGNNNGRISSTQICGNVTAQASGNSYAGGTAGYNSGRISSAQISGNVTAQASGASFAGGITGCNIGYIESSYNFSSVTSNSSIVQACAGGISGINYLNIQQCANTGTVIAGYGTSISITLAQAFNKNAVLYAGGIIGLNNDSKETKAKIIESHNIGGVMTQLTSASTSDNIFAGGLAGYVTGTLKDSTAANNTIDVYSSCWDKTSKYSVEYASDAQTGYTSEAGYTKGCTSGIDTVKGYVKRDLGSGTTNMPSYQTQYFLSFDFPEVASGTPYTGSFNSKSGAEDYVDKTIASINGKIYDNNGNPLATLKSSTSKGNKTESNKAEGSVKSGYELMKVTYTATGSSDQTVEFITHITEPPVSLTLDTSSVKKSYNVGQAFDTTNLAVTGKYSDSTTAALTSSDYTVTTDYTVSSPAGTYTVTVTSKTNPSATGTYSITVEAQITAASNSGYTVNQGNATLSGIRTNTSVSSLQSGLNQSVIVKNQNGQQITSGNVGTGMTVCLSGGGDPLTIVVKGDTSGDGSISISDMLLVKRQLLNISRLTSVYSIAGDVDGNGSISISDFILVKSQLLGKTTIN